MKVKIVKNIALAIMATIVLVSAAQTADTEQYRILVAKQQMLGRTQDSLQSLLATARNDLDDATADKKEALSALIVRLEGEVFDIRAKISRVGSDIAAIEEKVADQSLRPELTAPQTQSPVLYQTSFFTDNLSAKDIATLAKVNKVETEMNAATAAVEPLYAELSALKKLYDQSIVQSEVDQIRASAAQIKDRIWALDNDAAQKWLPLYNYALDTYLVLLDKAPSVDRSTIEAIEIESRDVRRAETFTQEGSLIPNLSVYQLQRGLLLSYERAIAKAANLKAAYDALMARKGRQVQVNFKDIEFLPKVLTVYGPVLSGYKYSSDNPADIAELILPEKGVYYSIQVSLMSAGPKSMDFFRSAWPLQVQKIDGKYRYLVGGFHTYEQAVKGVAALSKLGFKSPTLLAWNDAQPTTTTKARAAQTVQAEDGQIAYRIELTTQDPTVAEKLRTVVDMHAKDKSIVRLVKGDQMQFTISEFKTKEEAEVIAQIIRERTQSAVTVEQI